MNTLTWDDISLKTYNELQHIISDNSEQIDKVAKAIKAIYDVNMDEIPMFEALQMQNNIVELLNTKPNGQTLQKSYKVGKYECVPTSFDKMTMSQFMDYQEIVKQGDDHLIDIISICLVPKGQKYNNGQYDLDELKEEIGNLPSTIAPTLISFFVNRLNKLFRRFHRCLAVDIMNSKGMTMKQKIALLKTLPTMEKALATSITL